MVGPALRCFQEPAADAYDVGEPLYHHFPSRADLAARLLVDGMARSQQVVLSVLGGGRDAEQGVRDVVHAQLAWVQEHAELARLLYGDLPGADSSRAGRPSSPKRGQAAR